MALDAVVRLAHGVQAVHAFICKGKAVTMPQFMGMRTDHLRALLGQRLQRDQLLKIELLRDTEKDTITVGFAPCLRMLSPHCVACRRQQRVGVVGLILHPLNDMSGEHHLREGFAETLLQFRP